MPVLEIVAREGRPLVLVAENVEGQALAALIMNTTRGTLKVAAIKAPRYGQERRNILHPAPPKTDNVISNNQKAHNN